MQNEEGFTLLEMLLVMVVITILLLLIIPNVVTQRSFHSGKGCAKFYVKSIEAQIQVYQLQHNKIPSLKELADEKYITTDKCPNGESIHISDDGTVSIRHCETTRVYFLEMLLVLFVISVLSIVTYFSVHSLYERQKLNNF